MDMRWGAAALAWYIASLSGVTWFIDTIGHGGWHWVPAGIAFIVVGTCSLGIKAVCSA